jgi:hypothetical protein
MAHHESEQAELAMITASFETGLIINDGENVPKSYKDATFSKEWEQWWTAIVIEFNAMEEKGVWDIVEKSNVPTGRRIIGNRWVFAKKNDGRYRARTVAKGFSQIPGKDFQENHAPVVNDTTFRISLALKILYGLEAEQFDVETAFLYGELDEDLWMELPMGYSKYLTEKKHITITSDKHCLKLKKALYGLVQAARQWWKKFKSVMANIDFYPSRADPCLFIKRGKDEKTTAFVIIYVDDGGIIGSRSTINEILFALSKSFTVKSLGKMEHFVGCHILENKSKDTIWIHQPKLIKNLKSQFEHLVNNMKVYTTPAGPRTMIVRPQKGDAIISPEEQKKFRSGVGMLLYLVKHSRPDLANAVRELSKVNDGANLAQWKNLMRAIKFTLDTEHYALRLKPKKNQDSFYLEGVSDSEFAGDKDTRISVYGYILYFCGSPISWKSKSGKSVTLSSTEAEYFALSEVAKEAIFAKQVLESMGVKLAFPIIIKCDNVGAIYISNNYSVSQQTKHINTRQHFIREYIEDEIIKVIFTPSEKNDADFMTKNTTESIHQFGTKQVIDKKPQIG